MQKQQCCLLQEDRDQQAYQQEGMGLTPETQNNLRPFQWQGQLLFNSKLFSMLQPITFSQRPQGSSFGGETVGKFQFFTCVHSWEGVEGVQDGEVVCNGMNPTGADQNQWWLETWKPPPSPRFQQPPAEPWCFPMDHVNLSPAVRIPWLKCMFLPEAPQVTQFSERVRR